jgi:hypothetical protein
LTATTFTDIVLIVVSMQYQQRTNQLSVEWRSCRSVILCDGELHCLLEPEKTYDLAEAYEDNLHVRFANADSDKELMDFIRAWGPLYIPNGQIPKDGVIALPLKLCRTYQRQVKAAISALTSFKWGEGEREALEELIAARIAVGGGMLDPDFAIRFRITGNVLEWPKGAGIADVRTATSHLVESVVTPIFHLRLVLRSSGSRRRVEAGWSFMNLEEAVRWMIWYDEFTKHPIICCAECRTVFRGDTARARKYCSTDCGHRATARETMRRKRAAERAERK